jgi:metal-responsive CopG/Arc/MetJ family transcriptional regulator
MKRTTISLPDDLAARIEREAARRQTSVSEVFRTAVVEHLGLNRPRVLPFIGLGHSGHSNTASQMEELLAETWANDIEADAFNR